jgi:uncharacterized membrane protein
MTVPDSAKLTARTSSRQNPSNSVIFSQIGLLLGISTLLLFFCSSLRHYWFQSGAFDLGIFDQYLYLVSQNLEPISSFVNYHLLGDHAAYILYLLSGLYQIKPDVHWLFGIQSLSLTSAIAPIYLLAKQTNISHRNAIALVYSYLLYPLVFNANLFDFHPEVIAVPVFLWAVYCVRSGYYLSFIGLLIIILGCKWILAITVIGLGFWCGIGEQKWRYGLTAIALGVTWLIVVHAWVLPGFREGVATGVERYAQFGNTPLEILWGLLRSPMQLCQQVFSWQNLEYVACLFLPFGWALVPRYWGVFICALPHLALNLLADYSPQKNIVQHYSLPILPFLILSTITTLAAHQSFLKQRSHILLWSLITFLALGKYGYFWTVYADSFDTLQASHTAVNLIGRDGSVLTTHAIAPHLTHRPNLDLIHASTLQDKHLERFQYILLNSRHPGWQSSQYLSETLRHQLEAHPQFTLQFAQDEVYLFRREQNVPKEN